MEPADAPWWREYSEHPPRVYDSVRAPLHEAFARAAKAYSARVVACALGEIAAVEAMRAAVRDWAELGYLTGATIDSLRRLLSPRRTPLPELSGRGVALALAALEISRTDCNATCAREWLAQAEG